MLVFVAPVPVARSNEELKKIRRRPGYSINERPDVLLSSPVTLGYSGTVQLICMFLLRNSE